MLLWRGGLEGDVDQTYHLNSITICLARSVSDGPGHSAKNLFDEPQIKFERIQGQRIIHSPKWKIIRIKCYDGSSYYTTSSSRTTRDLDILVD